MNDVISAGFRPGGERFQVEIVFSFFYIHCIVEALGINQRDGSTILCVIFFRICGKVFFEPKPFYLFFVLGEQAGNISASHLLKGESLPVAQACRLQAGSRNILG